VDRNIATFRYEATSGEAYFFQRKALARYEVLSADRVRRIPPLAPNMMGFLREWLDLEDSEAIRWSSPQAAREHRSVVAWTKDDYLQLQARICPGTPRVWHIEATRDDAEMIVFVVRENGARDVRMLSIERQSPRACPIAGMEALARELR
jgi:hypothetical protein